MEGTPALLPLRQRLCFSVGHVLNDVCASMWFTYLLVFFQMVLGWPAKLAGIIMLIGQVADGVSTPFVGLQSDLRDDFWLCRYGRRKTWHLMGTICVMLSFPFIFSPCVGCAGSHQWAQLIYYASFVCIFQFGWAAVQISHLSLIPDLTPSAHHRTGLIASRYTFTVISNVLVYCLTWAVLHMSSDDCDRQIGPQDITNFQIVVAIGLGIGALTSIIFHFGVREKPSVQLVEEHATTQGDNNTSDHNGTSNGTANSVLPANGSMKTAAEHMCTFQLYQVAGVYMSTRLFANLSQVYMPLYLHQEGLSAESLAIVPLVMFLSSFATSFVIKPLNLHCGRRGAYVIGCLLGLSGCIWVWYGAGKIYSTYEVYAVAVLMGASSSMQLVTSLGLTADLIGQDTDSGAFVYGAMSFLDKLSNGLVVSLLQAYFHQYYRDVLAFVCGGAAILGLLSIATLVRCRTRTRSTSHAAKEEGNTEENGDTINGSTKQLVRSHQN